MKPALLPVPPERVSEFWPLCAPLIQTVIDKMGDDTPLDILYADLKDMQRQLWIVADGDQVQAAVMTIISQTDVSKIGYLTHAAGHHCKDWIYITKPIGDFFAAEGCDKFVIVGRKGWSKLLPDFDCSRIYMEKRL